MNEPAIDLTGRMLTYSYGIHTLIVSVTSVGTGGRCLGEVYETPMSSCSRLVFPDKTEGVRTVVSTAAFPPTRDLAARILWAAEKVCHSPGRDMSSEPIEYVPRFSTS